LFGKKGKGQRGKKVQRRVDSSEPRRWSPVGARSRKEMGTEGRKRKYAIDLEISSGKWGGENIGWTDFSVDQ